MPRRDGLTWVAMAVATAGGVGMVPVAPGTAGTLVTVPLAWALRGLPLAPYLAVVAGITVAGVWAAGRADRAWGGHDSQRIVVDEVAGYLLTVALVPRGDLLALAAGFIAFRALDIGKPPPIGWLDRHVEGGLGVVLDDVAAGALGAVLLWAGWTMASG